MLVPSFGKALLFLVLAPHGHQPSWVPQRREQNHARPSKVHTRSHFFVFSKFRTKFKLHTCHGCRGYCKGILNTDDYIISWNDSFGKKSCDPLFAMNYSVTQGLWVVTLHGVTVEWCIWAAGSSKTCLRSAPRHQEWEGKLRPRERKSLPWVQRELEPEPGLAAGCHGGRSPDFYEATRIRTLALGASAL